MTPTPSPLPQAEAELLGDMARLGERPYSEVGVPMFLIVEDRVQAGDSIRRSAGDAALSERLTQIAAMLDAYRPGHGEADVARAIEVLADRCLLSPDGPVFSRLGADAAERPKS